MLTRVKTFVATGLATAGRLYAGDLNAIQDAVAAQSDFSQRVDVGTLGVGETALAVIRYGPGEARITGAVRLDGILRAMGGLWGAQFTTAARDAIATGVNLTPYGLIIFNTTTNRYEWNKGNDTTRNWQPLSGTIVEKNGAGPVSEGGINLIEGSGIQITLADNPGTGFADVTIAAPPAAVGGTVPIGGSIEYGGNSDPLNYLLEDGRSLLRAGTYAALFAVIGTTFGSADGTHFNIPDCRGRAAYGPNTNVPLGVTEGLASANARSPQHVHQYTDTSGPDAVLGGAHLAPSHSPAGTYFSGFTSGNGSNQDSGAFIGKWKAIRYQ